MQYLFIDFQLAHTARYEVDILFSKWMIQLTNITDKMLFLFYKQW